MHDHELLREYSQNRSQDAFRELVETHLGMVYSAACRIVRDPQIAEEVAQGVFSTLAQKADSIGPPQVVSGWLYNTTRHLAMHAVRTEQRRREREQIAVAMQALDQPSDSNRVCAQLEPAMAELPAEDRDALVLRYLESRSLRELGVELGITEDAARMRVNRALERLRTVFARQGVGVTSVLLASTLATGTTSAVPAGLGAAITATALAATIAATSATQTVISTMNWINAKTLSAIAGAAVLAGTGTYLVQERQADRLRSERDVLVARQNELKAAVAAARSAAQTRNDELEQLQADAGELLRLRNEVSQLRQQVAAAKQRAAPPPAALPPPDPSAGAYISKDQLAHVGYATPEAALQTITWTMIHGTLEQAREGLGPELAREPDGETPEGFAQKQKMMAPLFKGLQFVAKKVVNDDKVELKVRIDADPVPGQPDRAPQGFLLQPMVRVGDQWKLGGSTMGYDASAWEKWEQDGKVQTIAQ